MFPDSSEKTFHDSSNVRTDLNDSKYSMNELIQIFYDQMKQSFIAHFEKFNCTK